MQSRTEEWQGWKKELENWKAKTRLKADIAFANKIHVMNQNLRLRPFMPVIIIVLLLCECTSSKKNIAAKDTSEVIFFDDFSKHTLDRSKWNVVVTGFTVNNEQQAYVDSSAT